VQPRVREAKHLAWLTAGHFVPLDVVVRFRACEAMVPSRQQLDGTIRSYFLDRSRVHVVPNGISVDDFDAHGREEARKTLGLGPEPILLSVGRLARDKGFATAIQALARIASPDARLVILGVELERDPPGVESRGEVLDREEVRRSYEQAAAFCLPSRFEPTGMSVMEAMAFGLPVVGTRVGGIPEAIEDGATGILVDQGDRRGLRDALLRLIGDPEEAARMGRNGRRWIDSERNWDAVVDRMLAAVSGHGARASSR